MKSINVVAFDPAIRNLGIAKATISLDDLSVTIDRLTLIQTQGEAGKTVRKNSDDLRRACELYNGMVDACDGAAFAIAEIPVGTQSARGAMSNGIMIGVLAACPIPLIQVQPTEVKMASVGIKTATKGEMIDWAMKQHPLANWLMRKSKGKLVPINDNEHLADAVAAVYAGIRTDQFRHAVSIFRSIETPV